MQLGAFIPPLMEPPNAEKFKAEEMEQLADRFAGIYIERTTKGFRTWNFQGLLTGPEITEIECETTGKVPVATLYAGHRVIEILEDDVAVAFIRYLHYLGIFELAAAKRPCPDCGNKPPQDCETCGGLGWVL
jgi:hypothetical protein